MAKLKIKNKIIIFFVVIYTIYLSVILAFTYVSNKDILESALKDRITQTYYQLSGNISENKKTQSEVLPKLNKGTPNEGEKNSAAENLSEDFIVLNEHLYADKALKYKAVNGGTLEDKALIGLKLSGENNGVKLNVKWEGESLNQVKNAQKGEYRLAVSSLEDLVINNKNYGKVKFIVKIIIE